MSKIGKKKILIPERVKISIVKDGIEINGPNGSKKVELNMELFDVKISEKNELSIKPKKMSDSIKKIWGMNRSLMNNAVIGADKGYEKILQMTGVGYRAAIKGDNLNLQLGFSHDVNFAIPKDVKIIVEKLTTIKINGSDKHLVGMVASKIKSFRPTEPYKGKGIKEKDEYVVRKEGKKK